MPPTTKIPHGLNGRDSRNSRERLPAAGWTPTWSPGPGMPADRTGSRGARGCSLGPWPADRLARRNRDGETMPGGRITPEARPPGWLDTRSPSRTEPMCARGTVTLHTCSAWTRIWIGTGNSSPRPGPRGKPMCTTRRRPADRLGRDQSYCLHHGPDGR